MLFAFVLGCIKFRSEQQQSGGTIATRACNVCHAVSMQNADNNKAFHPCFVSFTFSSPCLSFRLLAERDKAEQERKAMESASEAQQQRFAQQQAEMEKLSRDLRINIKMKQQLIDDLQKEADE